MEYIILIKYMAWNYLAIAMGDKDYWKYDILVSSSISWFNEIATYD